MGNHCIPVICERCGEEFCVRCEVSCNCTSAPAPSKEMIYPGKINFDNENFLKFFIQMKNEHESFIWTGNLADELNKNLRL